MYQEVSTDLRFVDHEEEVEQYQQENHVFEKSVETRRKEAPHVFYDGPSTANGKPYIGHMLTRVIEGLLPHYQTMKGKQVPREASRGTHGLPVELEVEELPYISSKDQIEAYGLESFIDKRKESVWKYKDMWEDSSCAIGFQMNMNHPYVTYDNNFIESEWWALERIWKKELLYGGFKIVPYCPRCGAPLSSHEVAQGHKDVKERSAVVKFRVKGKDAYILAWTATPWTLPSSVALYVSPDERCAKVKKDDTVYYMATELVNTVLGEDTEILESFAGTDPECKEYEPLLPFVQPKERCWFVTCNRYVTLTDDTGVVHTASAFGEDDVCVEHIYSLPFVQLVDGKGQMTKETAWPGVFVRDTNLLILGDLKARSLLFVVLKFGHSYPFCWCCDTPLIYYARESWFVKMTAIRENLIRNNNTVNWIPLATGKDRFDDWLESVQDWDISHNRYWSTPLNIQEYECGCRHAIGNIEELKKMSPSCPEDIELHRPYVDAVTITCPDYGKQMHRVSEVIDY